MSIAPDTRLQYEMLREEFLPAIMEIEREAYPEPWTIGMFREEMRSKRSYFYTGWLGNTLVGYSGFWLVLDEGHITSLTVQRDYRGFGYGREQLMHLLAVGHERDVRAFTLEVRESNERARQLYESVGFRPVGTRKGYYSTTREDAIVMLKELP
jgi:ribosomal-protein-alanine N-acetyltransferase